MADEGCGCGCGETTILVGGTPGPQGPAGPQGPPGPGAVFPIPADQISVTNPGFSNVQEVLDYLLYIPLVIDSFFSVVTNYLIGSSVSSLTFVWSINKVVITKTISGPNLVATAITTSPSTMILSGALAPAVVGTSYTYTLNANDGVNTVGSNTTINFLNKVYFGDSVVPGSLDSTFVNTLTGIIQANITTTMSSNATGPTTYVWFASRTALGTASFSVGGFPGGFNAAVVVSVTNTAGFTENYNVYRSTNPAIGPVVINVV